MARGGELNNDGKVILETMEQYACLRDSSSVSMSLECHSLQFYSCRISAFLYAFAFSQARIYYARYK